MEEKEIEQLVEDRFRMINLKFRCWKGNLEIKFMRMEQDVWCNNLRITMAITSHPSYAKVSLDTWMREWVGDDYSRGYTSEDWERHFRLDNLRRKL